MNLRYVAGKIFIVVDSATLRVFTINNFGSRNKQNQHRMRIPA